ncbi:hypothetical protein CAEBREN_13566 [Caenorhabditis brenneri]|uniref:Uncharacterized protein n=1 Tax=Caenorhabditis brenneri TaxID=135651 RepID=G0NTN1_CAEBE|nr:hypothetical protein CAEBREN_13566 [Caenorhabditis brenneri]
MDTTNNTNSAGAEPKLVIPPINIDGVKKEVFTKEMAAQMERAYPTEAVKKMHEKPAPATQIPHINRGSAGGKQRFIPQKQNH